MQMAFFAFIAHHRFIDGDEGFYLIASKLVMMGKKPYLEFFYDQTPLLPYVYALWMHFSGITWNSVRWFSALLTTSIGTLLYWHICQQTRRWTTGYIAVVIFASSTLVFAFFPVVKTFSLAALFLFSAYVVVTAGDREESLLSLAAGGCLLGFSVDTRSYLLLVAPVFCWWVFCSTNASRRLTSVILFIAGLVAGILPTIYFFVLSPTQFVFDNLGFHAIRSSSGLIGLWSEKAVVVLILFLGRLQCSGIQDSILFFISLAFVFSVARPKYAPRFAFQIAVTVGAISILPTPTFPQYFCLCLPFLVVSAVCASNELFTRLETPRERWMFVIASVLLVVTYLAASITDLKRYLVTGEEVPGVKWAADKADWRLHRVVEVSEAIDQSANPGEEVASFWVGDVFQTKEIPLPGLENDFGLLVSGKLTAQQRVKYHILSPSDIEAEFAKHRPRIVVLRKQILSVTNAEDHHTMQQVADNLRSSLRLNGYVERRSIGEISIYVYTGKTDP